MTAEEIHRVLAQVRESVVPVEPTERIEAVAADPSDEMFLECAVAAGAEYIVSRDPHLLNLGEFRGIRIVLPAAFPVVVRASRG